MFGDTPRIGSRMENAKRILLLAPMPIGDTIFCAPTIRAIREANPAARIYALAHSNTAELIQSVFGVDEVIVLPVGRDWQGLTVLLSLLKRLRTMRFDVAIDFSSPAYKWITLLAGIPKRAYMKFDHFWWFLPGNHARWRRTHAAEHYYDCAREIGLPPWREIRHTVKLRLPRSARREADRCLAAHALARGRDRLVALHPGGTMLDGVKRWPVERYAAVADALHERWDARILLVGGRDEAELVNAVAMAMTEPSTRISGEVSLLASFALIAACDLFIGNDSGLLHAAAALGTPYVGVYGPTAVSNFHPLPQHDKQGIVLLPPAPCRSPRYFVGGDVIWSRPCCRGVCNALAGISTERVAAAADMLIQRRLSHVPAVS